MALDEIRRRPTLPGRFQPSTISVLRLNFCVRDGNRWIPQAIVTGKEQGSRLSLPRFLVPSLGNHLPYDFPSALSAPGFAPSKPHRSLRSVPPDHGFPSLRFDILLTSLRGACLCFASLLPPSGFLQLRSPLSMLHSLLKIKPSTD